MCECYVVVGNANVSATTHLGSRNNLKNHFMLVSNHVFSGMVKYSRMHVMHSLDPIWHPQKKRSHSQSTMILHDGIALSVFFYKWNGITMSVINWEEGTIFLLNLFWKFGSVPCIFLMLSKTILANMNAKVRPLMHRIPTKWPAFLRFTFEFFHVWRNGTKLPIHLLKFRRELVSNIVFNPSSPPSISRATQHARTLPFV